MVTHTLCLYLLTLLVLLMVCKVTQVQLNEKKNVGKTTHFSKNKKVHRIAEILNFMNFFYHFIAVVCFWVIGYGKPRYHENMFICIRYLVFRAIYISIKLLTRFSCERYHRFCWNLYHCILIARFIPYRHKSCSWIYWSSRISNANFPKLKKKHEEISYLINEA